jgi:hypothetical protein
MSGNFVLRCILIVYSFIVLFYLFIFFFFFQAAEKAVLDGTSPPVQTIIFENTNYKSTPDLAIKAKFSSHMKHQRSDKPRGE